MGVWKTRSSFHLNNFQTLNLEWNEETDRFNSFHICKSQSPNAIIAFLALSCHHHMSMATYISPDSNSQVKFSEIKQAKLNNEQILF